MVLYECKICNFQTEYTTNYNKHIRTKKHLRSIKNNENSYIPKNNMDMLRCKFCYKEYRSVSSLNKHINKCQNKPSIGNDLKIELVKKDCEINYHKQLNKKENEFKDELIKEKEKQIKEKDKVIELIKDKNSIVNNNNITTNNTINNNQQYTINYLNQHYGNVTPIEEFKKMYQNHIISKSLADSMENAFNGKDINEQSNIIVYCAKDVCRQNQIDVIPIICTDGNLRSHKEKTENGWVKKISNDNIVYMIDTTYKNTLSQYPDKSLFLDPDIRHSILPNSIKKRLSCLENIKVEKVDVHKDSIIKYYLEKTIELLKLKEEPELKSILTDVYITHFLNVKSILTLEKEIEIKKHEMEDLIRYLYNKDIDHLKLSKLYSIFFLNDD